MKRLQKKTVVKAFEKVGFRNHSGSDTIFCYVGRGSYGPAQWITLTIKDGGNIKTSGARWIKKHNVHIEAYWSYPESIDNLSKIIDEMKETYSELCDTKFEMGFIGDN